MSVENGMESAQVYSFKCDIYSNFNSFSIRAG